MDPQVQALQLRHGLHLLGSAKNPHGVDHVQWKNPGKSWKIMGHLGKSMEKCWKITGNHGKSMEKSWKITGNHGKSLEHHRENFKTSLENHWTIMEHQWNINGIVLGYLLVSTTVPSSKHTKSYGNPVRNSS